MIQEAEYGWRARVGLIVPPANTTLEPEIAALLPSGVSMYAARLPGRVEKNTSVGLGQRFEEYHSSLRKVADSFGGMSLSALCYGVTGSCYMVGLDGEDRLIADLKAGGAPKVITASRAIAELLRALNCRRIGVVTPYPAWLTELALKYWEASGFEVKQVATLPDVVSIYDIRTETVVSTVKSLSRADVDAILLSGTGVPTLPTIAKLRSQLSLPLISSNLSMGWWIAERVADLKAHEMLPPPLVPLHRWLDRQDGKEAARRY